MFIGETACFGVHLIQTQKEKKALNGDMMMSPALREAQA